MKRQSKIIGAALALVLSATAIAAIGWGVATTPGTRWLLTSAAPLIGVSFSAAGIEGRLLDHLLLTDVRVVTASRKLELDALELHWKPLFMPLGSVAVRQLTLKGVRIQDDTPLDDKKPLPAWPRTPASAQLLDVKIERLQVTGLSYRRLQEQPVPASLIEGSLNWQEGVLSVAGLRVISPSGNLSGAFSAGFNQPKLLADLAVAPAFPLAGMDRFSLRIIPGRESSRGRYIGAFVISGETGARKLLDLTGEVAMARTAFDLRGLRLTSPGRLGVVTAEGSLELKGVEPVMSLQLKGTGLDLAPELKLPTDLSGTLNLAGTPDSYRGTLTLANSSKGWQAAVISTPYRGTRQGVNLAPFSGSMLGGALAGELDVDWRAGFALRGAFSGRDLDPARIDPKWRGKANFDAQGEVAWSGKEPATGRVSGALLESTLHGKALTGELLADFAGDDLSVTRLALQGEGFDLSASGRLKKRLDLAARIGDFSRLVPGSAGTLSGTGWVRLDAGQLSGAMSGKGKRLAFEGARVASADLTVRLDQGPGHPLHVAASLLEVAYDRYTADAVTLAADGTLARHAISATLASAEARAQLTLSAGYRSGLWQGEISRLSGRDVNGPWRQAAPAAFSVSAGKLFLAPLSLTAGSSERFQVGADLTLNPLSGPVTAKWSGLNLARANPYLSGMQVTGNGQGSVRLGFLPGKRVSLAASATGRGTFTSHGRGITIERALATADGSDQGIRFALELATADGGALKGVFSSPAPFTLALPENGNLTAQSTGLDLALIEPWLPSGTRLEGRMSGRAKGTLLPGERFELSGDAQFSGGVLHRENEAGGLKLGFKAATASWEWRDEALTGALSLALAEKGKARAEFALPLPARYPVAPHRKGALRASLSGQLQEQGMVTALFPGLVRESFGELDADIKVAGTWEAPIAGGTLKLAKAGAYLPAAGIRLKEIQVAAHLEKNLVRIDSYRAVSGSGHVEGEALITLADWRVTGYQGTVRGENFQTIMQPEVRLLTTPDLSFTGTPEKITLRGELRLPELRIVDKKSSASVKPSGDVIREGRVAKAPNGSSLVLDASVRVVLGERVFVKVAGIDARLEGAVRLSMNSLESIVSTGEIRVAEGHYRSYGVDLEIVRGRLFLAGGPLNSPALDVLALRTIGEVRAGVKVSGTLRRPITRLYSEPGMPDVDIMSYIVLGHPIGGNGEQAGLVVQAAGALLTSGQAAVLQDQLKNRLGLSTLEIKGGVGAGSGYMGYKPLQVTAPGAIPADQQSGITETVLTVGKYLTPQLYVSYGKSLFTGNNLFRLRYDIFKKWQIETQAGGGESGADLFYKLEFR